MTDNIKLLRCPFCGGDAQRSRGGEGDKTRFGTGCARTRCPAHLFALGHTTQSQADAAWNTRAAVEADRAARVNNEPSISLQAAKFDFAAHLGRQSEFSLRTFGPGVRTKGVCDHIRKELIEVEANPNDLTEWIDVIILGLDGALRTGASPAAVIEALVSKQTKNEGRTWPDWRTADLDKAIEHVRAGDGQPAASAEPECWCETCRPITLDDMRMVLCPICGNKRCPHATDHRNACTGSNEPGQSGSSYGPRAAPVAQEPVRTDVEIVLQTEELARLLMLEIYSREAPKDLLFRNAEDPRGKHCWQIACKAQEILTATDPENAVAEVDDDPVAAQPQPFGNAGDLPAGVADALARMDALLDSANGLLSVPDSSATVDGSRADLATIRAALAAQPSVPEYPTRTGRAEGRLAGRPFQSGDVLPAPGSYCLVSGANCDIESDQHRGYSWRQVLGYSNDRQFICLQTNDCWPTVERTANCWFAEIPHPDGVAPTPPAVEPRLCPKCGADRSKVPCPGDLMNCPIRGEAQATVERPISDVLSDVVTRGIGIMRIDPTDIYQSSAKQRSMQAAIDAARKEQP